MKTIFTTILIIGFALLIWACGTTGTTNNTGAANTNSTTDPHAGHKMNDKGEMDHSAMESSPHAEHAPYDLQFIDTMIVHHQGAVDMAKECAGKAASTEVKNLCADVISSQTKEIEQMRGWRESWFKDSKPAINMQLPGMADSMKDMDMKKLTGLTGKDYDLEFVRQMVPHHIGAVEMAKEAIAKSDRAEIKSLSEAIIKAQQKEIDQMRSWQAAWK